MRTSEYKALPVGGDPENALNTDHPPRAYVHLFEDGDRRMAVMTRNPDNPDAGQPVHFDKDLMKECVKAVKESPKAGWEHGSYTLIDAFESGQEERQEEIRWMNTTDGEPGFMAANRPMKPGEFQDRVMSFGESMEVDLSKETITPHQRERFRP